MRALFTGKYFILVALGIAVSVLLMLFGCARKRPSEKPPIHLNPDMDTQPKYKAQSISLFFDDSSAMRNPISGTIALTRLYENDDYYKGKDEKGNFIGENPVPITMPLLTHGEERFDIYCSPCHSRVGDGKCIMVNRGYVPPPTFHSDRIRELPDGHIYDVITGGIRNMPGYHHQIPVDDRWAIVSYLRALQRSRNASLEDIPPELREKVR